MSTPSKAVSPLVGVDTYQSGYHLGRCQHWVSTLGVNTYLKEGAGWVTLPWQYGNIFEDSSPVYDTGELFIPLLQCTERIVYDTGEFFTLFPCI